MLIDKAFFNPSMMKNASNLKIELEIFSDYYDKPPGIGVSGIVFKLNKPPSNGLCNIDPENGTAMITYFTIFCMNWEDDDGTIDNYEYYSNK